MLHDVLGLVGVAEVAPGNDPGPPLMAVDELVEGRGVSRRGVASRHRPSHNSLSYIYLHQVSYSFLSHLVAYNRTCYVGSIVRSSIR